MTRPGILGERKPSGHSSSPAHHAARHVLKGCGCVRFLPDKWAFPGQFRYFDLYSPGPKASLHGRITLSVKHPTGKTPKFSIAQTSSLSQLAAMDNSQDGTVE